MKCINLGCQRTALLNEAYCSEHVPMSSIPGVTAREAYEIGKQTMGHQDRAYVSRIKRLRERVQKMTQEDPRTIVQAGVLLGMLDILADLVADQEEAESGQ